MARGPAGAVTEEKVDAIARQKARINTGVR